MPMKKFIVLSLAASAFLISSVHAQTKFDYNGSIGTRYNNSSTAKINAIQPSMVFGFTLSPAGKFDLVGLVLSGPYGKRYSTAIDFNHPEKNTLNPHLAFHNLYLQKSFQLNQQTSATGQFGVLGTDQKIGTKTFVSPTTAIGTNSWIDGARVRLNTRLGVMSLTGGSIYDITETNFVKRDRKLNYFEVQISKTVIDKVAFELSGGAMDYETFFRAASEEKVKLFSEHIVTLVQECLWNMDKNATSYSATASTDLGEIFNQNLKGRLNLDLRYSYNNPTTGMRGKTSNDLYLKGHVGTVALYGKVNKTGSLNWFTAYDFGTSTRYQLGMNWKVQKKKKATTPVQQ